MTSRLLTNHTTVTLGARANPVSFRVRQRNEKACEKRRQGTGKVIILSETSQVFNLKNVTAFFFNVHLNSDHTE